MPFESELEKTESKKILEKTRMWGGDIANACGVGHLSFQMLVNKIKARGLEKEKVLSERRQHGITCEPKMKEIFKSKLTEDYELKPAEKCVPPFKTGLEESCVVFADNFLCDSKSGEIIAPVEYKAPYDSMYNDVPVHYIIQLMYQIRCLDSRNGDRKCTFGIFYAQMFDKETKEPILSEHPVIKKVERNDDLIAWIEKFLRTFLDCYRRKMKMNTELLLIENPMPKVTITDWDPQLDDLDNILFSEEEISFSDDE